jgi:hypothetical protein
VVRRELARGSAGEVVIAGALGILESEWHPAGGVDPVGGAARPADSRSHPLFGAGLTAARLDGTVLAEVPLDPAALPFLHDHALDGVPLLPGVMGIEAFAELACRLAPGWHVAAVEDVRFLRPLKFYRRQPQTLRLAARLTPGAAGEVIAACRLCSERPAARAGLPAQAHEHFTARVRLARAPSTPPAPAPLSAWAPPTALPITPDTIYRVFFHGPAYQVLAGAAVEAHRAIGRLNPALPPDAPAGTAAWVMAPRLLELCFQTAALWSLATHGTLALPQQVEAVQVWAPAPPAGTELWAVVETPDDGVSFDARVVDGAGRVYAALRRYQGVVLPGTARLEV